MTRSNGDNSRKPTRANVSVNGANPQVPKDELDELFYEPPPFDLVRVWDKDEPGPLPFVLEDRIPMGFVTIFYAHSGKGKSYVALELSLSVCLGRPFLGFSTMKGNVLWIDTELNVDEMVRRAYQVARGLGLSAPPEGLFYAHAPGGLGSKDLHDFVCATVKEHDIQLVVVDSLTIGAADADVNVARDTTVLVKKLEEWGTVLCIDHVSKAGALNEEAATIFGSVFKRNIARSTMKLISPSEDSRALVHDKSNFGPLAPQISFRMTFEGDPLVYRSLLLTHEELAAEKTKTLRENRYFKALMELFERTGKPVPLEDLAKHLGKKEQTVRNILKDINPLIQRHGDSTYSPLPITDLLDSGNRESQVGADADGGAEDLNLAQEPQDGDRPEEHTEDED